MSALRTAPFASTRRGFTLVETVFGIALLLIIFLALFGELRASVELSAVAKAKAAATELANVQMEYLRGFSYDALGTDGGIPGGTVPQQETETVDGIPYTVKTFIAYVDDPADGLGASDENGVTTDYKVARVSVSYTLHEVTKEVVVVSDFAPPGIESTNGGGTLSLHVVDALGGGMEGATVEVVNDAVSPAVDVTTLSNADGYVIFGGAATSSEYQVYVSRAGYSGAQTYARDAENVNPTPGYLTVAQDDTTSATFAIDQLAALTLSSYSPATTTAFADSFDDDASLAAEDETLVSGGALTLTSDAFSGSARSAAVAPEQLVGWGMLGADAEADPGVSALVRVTDDSGTPLPDSVLPGNAAGFSAFPVSLAGVATSTYPALALTASFDRAATSSAVALLDWSLSYSTAPAAAANIPFTLTGTKTIGTDADSAPIYKTVLSGTTGAAGATTTALEWDAYTLALSGHALLESCPSAPYTLTPADATSSALIVGPASAVTLPVEVVDGAGAPVAGAAVALFKSDFAATVAASPCGLAYFDGIPEGTYEATAWASGYATTTFDGIAVAGHTATSTLVLP